MWDHFYLFSRKAVIKVLLCFLVLLIAGTTIWSMAYIGLDVGHGGGGRGGYTTGPRGDHSNAGLPKKSELTEEIEGIGITSPTVMLQQNKNKPISKIKSQQSIVNRIDDLTRIGDQRVFTAKSLYQLHHGIYKTEVSLAEDGEKEGDTGGSSPSSSLRFAFKTECRPPAKWHGQQGWGEVAVHILLSLWESFDEQQQRRSSTSPEHHLKSDNTKMKYTFENSVPFSVGGVVWVSSEMLKDVVHRDQCGLMTNDQIRNFIKHLSSQIEMKKRERGNSGNEDDPVAQRTVKDLQHYLEKNSNNDNDQQGKDNDDTRQQLHPFIGVILKWMPSHDDGALPTRERWLDTFKLPNSKRSGTSLPSQQQQQLIKGVDKPKPYLSNLLKNAPASKARSHFTKEDLLSASASGTANKKKPKRRVDVGVEDVSIISSEEDASLQLEVQRQISDVMAFDYILGNEDREEKNWFRDGVSGRYILMDNGFVFSGRGFKESICSMYPALLTCPPLLRHLSSSSKCKLPSTDGGTTTAGLCVFRPETVSMLEGLKTAWLSSSYSSYPSLAQQWVSETGSDILLQFLSATFRNLSTTVFDMPLARHRDARNIPTADCTTLIASAKINMESMKNSYNMKSTKSDEINRGIIPPVDTSTSSSNGLNLIALAIDARINRLLNHVEDCVSRFGPKMVFSHP